MTIPQAKQIFATHMQAARKRKLTAYESNQLSQARQTLRRAARPAMNPKPKRMTLEYAKQVVKPFHTIRKTEGGDYVIRGPWFPTGYFAPDLDDIVDTYIFESKRHASKFGGNVNRRKLKRPKQFAKSNPSQPVLIYEKVLRVEAQKGPGHICDAECKKFNHRYFHEFTSAPHMYGLPDKSILITHKRF